MNNVIPIRPGIETMADRRVAMLWDRYVILWRRFLESPMEDKEEPLIEAHREWSMAYLGEGETTLATELFRRRIDRLLEGEDGGRLPEQEYGF